MADSKEDRIRARAHQIWLNEGQPGGNEQRHWEQAAGEIDAEDAKGKKNAPAKAAPAKKPVTAAKKSGAAPAIAKVSKDAKKPAKKS